MNLLLNKTTPYLREHELHTRYKFYQVSGNYAERPYWQEYCQF